MNCSLLPSERMRKLGKSRLRITDVGASDNGVYSCSARNNAGSVNSQENFILNIRSTWLSSCYRAHDRVVVILSVSLYVALLRCTSTNQSINQSFIVTHKASYTLVTKSTSTRSILLKVDGIDQTVDEIDQVNHVQLWSISSTARSILSPVCTNGSTESTESQVPEY